MCQFAKYIYCCQNCLFGLHMHIMYMPLWRYECHILHTSHCMVHVGGEQLPAPPSTTGNPPPAQHPPQSSTSVVHYPPPPLTSTAPGGTHQLLSHASTTSSTRMGLSQPYNMRQPGIAGSTQAVPPPTHPSNTQAGPPPTHPSSTQAAPPPTHPGSTQAGPPPTHPGSTQAGPPPTHPGSTQAGPPPTHPGSTQAGPPPTHSSSTQAGPPPVGTIPPSTGQLLGRPPGQLTGMYSIIRVCVRCCFVHVPYSQKYWQSLNLLVWPQTEHKKYWRNLNLAVVPCGILRHLEHHTFIRQCCRPLA